MSKTRLSKTGQPVMGTTIELALVDGGWVPAIVVGKLFGRMGNAHLIGLIVELPDASRQRVDWPMAAGDWRHAR